MARTREYGAHSPTWRAVAYTAGSLIMLLAGVVLALGKMDVEQIKSTQATHTKALEDVRSDVDKKLEVEVDPVYTQQQEAIKQQIAQQREAIHDLDTRQRSIQQDVTGVKGNMQRLLDDTKDIKDLLKQRSR